MIHLILAATLLGADAQPAAPSDPPQGGPSAVSTGPSLLGFAQSLYQEGDYYRAITEAKRFVYFHPGDASLPEAKLLIGQSYLAGEQWLAAAAALEPLTAEVTSGPVGADAEFGLADARMGNQDFDLAALEYKRFASDFPEDSRAALADLRVGWAWLYAADALAARAPKKGSVAFAVAARQLGALPPGHPEHARVEKLAAGAKQLASLPRRSPALAGTLSAVVPGAGQLYSGRPKDALIAFFVNGMFIAGAVEAFHRQNNVAGAVLVLFEMGWYTGNIYSGINSAHRHNDEARGSILKSMKKDLYFGVAPQVSPVGSVDGAAAGVGGRF
jgi:hypothetical protein